VAQGLVTGLLFWLAGVPYSPLLTLVAVVASMFPLGASLVAIPVGVGLAIVGKYVGAAVVLLGYFLLVSNIDSFLRPRLVSKEAYLNFALVLLSALGGYELFGFFGVVYGPVLMILFLTMLEVYETYYSDDQEPELPLFEDEEPPLEDSGPHPPAASPVARRDAVSHPPAASPVATDERESPQRRG
jgi:predicted PurR-regulated permease PerM